MCIYYLWSLVLSMLVCRCTLSLSLINLVKDIFHIFEMIIALAFKHLNRFVCVCVLHTNSNGAFALVTLH